MKKNRIEYEKNNNAYQNLNDKSAQSNYQEYL